MEPRDKLSCWCLRFDKLRSFNDFECRVQKWSFISNEWLLLLSWIWDSSFYVVSWLLHPNQFWISTVTLKSRQTVKAALPMSNPTFKQTPRTDGVTCGARRAGWRTHQLSIPRAIQRTRRCRIYEACTNLLWFWPSKIVKGNPTTTDFG